MKFVDSCKIKKGVFVIGFLLFVTTSIAYTENLTLPDPLEAGWQGKPVCENLYEDIQNRFLRCIFPPGIGHERHFHAPHFGYAISGGRVQIKDENGLREVDLSSGSSFTSEGTPWHEIFNIGTTTVSYLIVERKERHSAGKPDKTIQKEKTMSASGSFEVTLDPQNDQDTPAGRMLIHKQYTGDLEGTGLGQMISKRTEKGASVYAAIEEFEGTVDSKTGTFTLLHNGHMSSEAQSLEITIVKGSGTGQLENISGSMVISQDNDKHQYTLNYDL